MSYPPGIVSEVQKVSTNCFICNHRFGKHDYRAVHSGTGLHLVLAESESPARYVYLVTDPPDAYANLKNKQLEVDSFPVFGHRYFADAVCVCNKCHKEIHSLALELCRSWLENFTGNTPTPRILAEATFRFHEYRNSLAK